MIVIGIGSLLLNKVSEYLKILQTGCTYTYWMYERCPAFFSSEFYVTALDSSLFAFASCKQFKRQQKSLVTINGEIQS